MADGSIGRSGHRVLTARLSGALVAYTIELDNEFEHRSPHSTTRHGSSGGAWLVSWVMYQNCLRFLGEDGVSVREMERLARTKTNLNGMQRWGYVRVEPDPARKGAANAMVRPTAKGARAREVWKALVPEIDGRWNERFGGIGDLREALQAVDRPELPDGLPILGFGLWSNAYTPGEPSGDDSLPALLARVLLSLAIEFENESEVSLAISADILRVMDAPARELPRLSGVSKEAVKMGLGWLQKRGFAAIEAGVARMTPSGVAARERYLKWTRDVDRRKNLSRLRELLALDFSRGLEPYPEGWRARVKKPETLPDFPMVLHRGGYPDGS